MTTSSPMNQRQEAPSTDLAVAVAPVPVAAYTPPSNRLPLVRTQLQSMQHKLDQKLTSVASSLDVQILLPEVCALARQLDDFLCEVNHNLLINLPWNELTLISTFSNPMRESMRLTLAIQFLAEVPKLFSAINTAVADSTQLLVQYAPFRDELSDYLGRLELYLSQQVKPVLMSAFQMRAGLFKPQLQAQASAATQSIQRPVVQCA